MKISLTEEQWQGLIRPDNAVWLPPCCAGIESARKVLREAWEAGGEVSDRGLAVFIAQAIPHDVIREAWHGQPDQDPECSWIHRSGSPWPEIFRALKASILDRHPAHPDELRPSTLPPEPMSSHDGSHPRQAP